MKIVRPRNKQYSVCLTSGLCVRMADFDDDQIEALKDSLTFDNPAYATTKRFSPYSRVAVDPMISYYHSSCGYLHIPAGSDLSPLNDPPVLDKRISVCADTIPEFVLKLREDQQTAAYNYIKMNRGTKLRGAVQLPTGKGKTILALYLAAKLGMKTLVLVHKDDLVKGWQKDIALAFNNKCHPGLIKAKKRVVGEFITIATVQTLSRMDEVAFSELKSKFGMIIMDEMHHCVLGDTQVVLKDGGVSFIKDISDGDSVFGGTTTHSFCLQAPVFRLHAKHGFIDGSADHPTFCFDKRKYYNSHIGCCDFSNAVPEVKAITELDSNYVIPILRRLPHTVKNSTDVHVAKLAAMIMCDGHLDRQGNRVKVNVHKDKEYYTSLFEQSGIPFSKSTDCRGNLTLWCTDAHLKQCLEKDWLINRGKKSTSIQIPSFMYYAPWETLKAFIEVCFSCEGDLSINAQGNCRINLVTTSRAFVQGMSMLLKKFGIVANIQVIYKDGVNDAYRLSCCGDMFNVFMDTFTLIDRKMTTIRNKATVNANRVWGDYILSDVKYVDSLGYVDSVYDFEVQGTHSFIANGVLTHNCPASMFSIVSEFTSRYRLGLTATAERKDGLAHVMKLYFGDFCYKYKATSDEKDILPVEVIRRNADFLHIDPLCKKVDKRWILVDPRTDPNSYKPKKDEEFISQVPYKVRPKIVFSEYSDLIVRLLRDFILTDVVNEYKQGHSCIVFFSQKQQIDDFADYLFRYMGVPRSHILKYYGDNNEKQNEETLMQAEQNRKRITLATYSKATEGTNVKRWEVEFLAGSLNDGKNVEQAVGRIRRTTKEPKLKVARVYDYRCPYVYSISSHAATRDARYRKLGFTFINDPSQSTQKVRVRKEKPALFTRGYSH